MRKLFLALILILTGGCFSSRPFSPPDSAKEAFARALKTVMPSDVIADPSAFIGKEIHWIGILRDVQFKDDTVAIITLDQKYWDYIEDYGIQSEKMFLSPKGEGEFLLLFPMKNRTEFAPFIKESIDREDLMFVYGVFQGIQNDKPVLKYTNGGIFVHEKFYSTTIWEYEILRDNKGAVVPSELGVPVTINLKVLKVPGPGDND